MDQKQEKDNDSCFMTMFFVGGAIAMIIFIIILIGNPIRTIAIVLVFIAMKIAIGL